MSPNDAVTPMHTMPTVTNNASQVLAILHQFATAAGGSTPGGQELLACLAGIEDTLHTTTALAHTVPPSLPLPPSAPLDIPSTPLVPSPDVPTIMVGTSTNPPVNLPAINVLVHNTSPPFASLPLMSSSLTLTLSTSPIHT
ncbi:hypothetical protein EV401DRAFT_2066346 [Pisolithus croceorrhizus]|nr:hypothetical protein EV401DRAFT_2066346 [Pisolithus croceorrhizus]